MDALMEMIDAEIKLVAQSIKEADAAGDEADKIILQDVASVLLNARLRLASAQHSSRVLSDNYRPAIDSDAETC